MESNPFISNFSSMPTPGDFVVGRYNSLGAAIEEGTPLIPEVKIKKLRESVARSAYSSGGKVLTPTAEVKPKKTKAKVIKKPTVQTAPVSPKVEFNLEEVIDQINDEEKGITRPYADEKELEIKYQPKEILKKKKIVFSNDFGNIKLYAEDVLQCDMALALIFKDEEALTFIPKIGENLSLKIEDEEPLNVYFPGSLFTWTDNIKNVIILFKNNE